MSYNLGTVSYNLTPPPSRHALQHCPRQECRVIAAAAAAAAASSLQKGQASARFSSSSASTLTQSFSHPDVASPTIPQSATSSSSHITSVVRSQLNILLTQLTNLREDKGRTKWDTHVEKIKKVRLCLCQHHQHLHNHHHQTTQLTS